MSALSVNSPVPVQGETQDVNTGLVFPTEQISKTINIFPQVPPHKVGDLLHICFFVKVPISYKW